MPPALTLGDPCCPELRAALLRPEWCPVRGAGTLPPCIRPLGAALPEFCRLGGLTYRKLFLTVWRLEI